MSDLTSLLAAVHTLSAERKDYLTKQYEAGALTSEERAELKEHILLAMERVSVEVEHAQGILQHHSSGQ
jgi:hypothetical protein